MVTDELELHTARPPRRRPLPGPGHVRPFEARVRPDGPLESWAHLDPTGLAPRLVRVARLLPGVSTVEQRFVAPLEARVLQIAFARARIVLPPTATGPAPRVVQPEPARTGGDDLAEAMLGRLVPDELRVLQALAANDVFPLVHVLATRRDGESPVLSNASTVGRAAAVARPDRTPAYVARLVHLGLARVGPRDDTLRVGYDELLADEQVAAARAEGTARRRLGKARVDRRTLRITDFGRELWQAHQPRGGETREDR